MWVAAAGCAAANRECVGGTTEDATCGNCLTGFTDNNGTCEEDNDANCDPVGTAGSILQQCNDENRQCTQTSTSAFCGDCHRSLVRLAPPICERCGAPGAWPERRCAECTGRRLAFATARAAIVYDARARSFVHAWKERGRRDLAAVAAEIVVSVVPAPTSTRHTPRSFSSSLSAAKLAASGCMMSSSTVRPQRATHFEIFCVALNAAVTT